MWRHLNPNPNNNCYFILGESGIRITQMLPELKPSKVNQLLVFYARHLGATPPKYLRSAKSVSSLTSGLYNVSLLWL